MSLTQKLGEMERYAKVSKPASGALGQSHKTDQAEQAFIAMQSHVRS